MIKNEIISLRNLKQSRNYVGTPVNKIQGTGNRSICLTNM